MRIQFEQVAIGHGRHLDLPGFFRQKRGLTEMIADYLVTDEKESA